MTERPTESRRSERSRRAILDAAFEIATEAGYAELSIEAIARRAKVGKQTIYRWWPSKGAVVFDAFIERISPRLEWTEHGDLHEELISQLTRVHNVLSDPGTAPHIIGLVSESLRDPLVAERFRSRVIRPFRQLTLERLEAAQAGQQLRHDADLDLLADALFAPLWFRLLLAAAPLDDLDVPQHVRQVLDGTSAS